MKGDPDSFLFRGKVWIFKGPTDWFFVTLPKKQSTQIKFLATGLKSGWGSVRVDVTVGDSQWKTSLFPEKKSGCYVLPLKAEIRKKEYIAEDKTIAVTVRII